jgi:hypothetical protein
MPPILPALTERDATRVLAPFRPAMHRGGGLSPPPSLRDVVEVGCSGRGRLRMIGAGLRFFKRRGGTANPSQMMDALTLHAGGKVAVVGESHRQEALARVAREATGPEPYLGELKGRARSMARNPDRVWFRAALLREPGNPYDPNAIAVHATGVGLPRYESAER